MPTSFPSGLDTLLAATDLSPANELMDGSTGANPIKHSKLHGDANDAISALEAKVGINGSAVATSLDFKNATNVTNIAANTAAIALKLTSPLTTRGDLLTQNPSGTHTRLGVGGNATFLRSNGTDPAWASIVAGDLPTIPFSGVSGTVPINQGGSGQITATLGFNALSPVTTRGDLIARGATDNQRLALGATGTLLQSNGTDPVWNSDITLPTGVYTAGALVGGRIQHGTQYVANNTYTMTQDPTDSSVGTPFLSTGTVTTNYATPKYATIWYGQRCAFQSEQTFIVKNNENVGAGGKYSFGDELLIMNDTPNARTMRASAGFEAARMIVGDGAAITGISGDWATGPTGFSDCITHFNTTNGGTGSQTWAEQVGFRSQPYFGTGTVVTTRVAFDAQDCNIYSLGDLPTIVAGQVGLANVRSGYTSPTNQIGLRISRMVNATNNYGIKNDSTTCLWSDAPTFAAAPIEPLQIGGSGTGPTAATWSFNYASNSLNAVIDILPTISLQQTASATGFTMINLEHSHQNTAAATGALGSDVGVLYQPTINAVTNAMTMTNLRGYSSSPTTQITTGGTLTITNQTGFFNGLTNGASVTVTTMRGVHLNPPTNSGTITNMIGVDFGGAWTNGATKNREIRMLGGGGVEMGDPNVDPAGALGSSAEILMFAKNHTICFKYNDAGTVRYKSLSMVGTGVTWVAGTVAP